MTYDWSAAGPVEKGWLARNREVLELWRSGTERPKALYIPARSMTIMTLLPVVQKIREFAGLAQLDRGEIAWRPRGTSKGPGGGTGPSSDRADTSAIARDADRAARRQGGFIRWPAAR